MQGIILQHKKETIEKKIFFFFKKLFQKSNFDKKATQPTVPVSNAKPTVTNINHFINSVSLLQHRCFYDNEWLINTSEGSVKITRYDTETIERLCSLLQNVLTIEEIKSLDLKSKIYYD